MSFWQSKAIRLRKSTLLSLLSGLERPDEGEIYVDGQSLSTLSEDELALLRREKVGLVFQTFNLIPTLTALENVEFPLYPVRAARKYCEENAKNLLELVGLKERMHHLPAKLSGGEKQRVAVARALVNNPKMVFADEPAGNLDSVIGSDIFRLIKDLNRKQQITFVMVTHDEGLASMAASRAAANESGIPLYHQLGGSQGITLFLTARERPASE